jgi:hypothetical protein
MRQREVIRDREARRMWSVVARQPGWCAEAFMAHARDAFGERVAASTLSMWRSGKRLTPMWAWHCAIELLDDEASAARILGGLLRTARLEVGPREEEGVEGEPREALLVFCAEQGRLAVQVMELAVGGGWSREVLAGLLPGVEARLRATRRLVRMLRAVADERAA